MLRIFFAITVLQLLVVIRWGQDEMRREQEAIQAIGRTIVDERSLVKRAQEASEKLKQQRLARLIDPFQSPLPSSSHEAASALFSVLRKWWQGAAMDPSMVEDSDSCLARSSQQDLLLAVSSTAVTVEGPDYGGGIVTWKFPEEAEDEEEAIYCVFGRIKRPARVDVAGGNKVVSCQAPPHVHYLQQAESLRSVAATYGMTIDDILRLNVNIGDPNKVFLGQKIALSEEQTPMFLAHPRLSASSRHYYRYISVELESIRPHSSLLRGGETLTLRGSGFVSSTEPCRSVCRVGNLRIVANVVSSSEMTCVVPSRWRVNTVESSGRSSEGTGDSCLGEVSCGQAAVEVSMNGKDFTRSGLFLTYSRAPICLLPMLEKGQLLKRYRLLKSHVVLPVWSSEHGEETESILRLVKRWKSVKGVAGVSLVTSLPLPLGLEGVNVIQQDSSSWVKSATRTLSVGEETALLRMLLCLGLEHMKGEEEIDYLTVASPYALVRNDLSIALSSLEAEAAGKFSLIGSASFVPLHLEAGGANGGEDASSIKLPASSQSVAFVSFPMSAVRSICKSQDSLTSPLNLLRNNRTRLVDASSAVTAQVENGRGGFLGMWKSSSGKRPGEERDRTARASGDLEAPGPNLFDYANWALRIC